MKSGRRWATGGEERTARGGASTGCFGAPSILAADRCRQCLL
jgi:hypothetical protein